LLLQSRNAGKTIFLSSHLLSEVELVCDRVAVLHHGKLRRLGRTSELLQSSERSEIVARGVSANLFAGATARDGVVAFTVPAAKQRDALEQVWAMGGEIVSVNPLRRSLEQIFLQVTGAKAEGSKSPVTS
jgi:ABC-2 type transport system ATP-binding protein